MRGHQHLGGNGYPSQAQHLVEQILKGPPEANECWLYDRHDILGKDWPGRTMNDLTAAGECRPEEWLLVEAWDES